MNNRWRTIKRFRKKYGIVNFLGYDLRRFKVKNIKNIEIPKVELSKPVFSIDIDSYHVKGRKEVGMDLKKIDLNKLQDYAFTPDELAMEPMVEWDKFINIKCLDDESIVPTVQAITVDKIKQAREEIENIGMFSYLEFIKEIACNDSEFRMSKKFAIAILDKLIAEN